MAAIVCDSHRAGGHGPATGTTRHWTTGWVDGEDALASRATIHEDLRMRLRCVAAAWVWMNHQTRPLSQLENHDLIKVRISTFNSLASDQPFRSNVVQERSGVGWVLARGKLTTCSLASTDSTCQPPQDLEVRIPARRTKFQ